MSAGLSACALVSARVYETHCQLLFPARRCEVHLRDVAILAIDTEHRSLNYSLPYRFLADDALIGERARDLYRLRFTGSRFAEIDHHRHQWSDGHPFIALV